jgi:hypothetical protein
MYYYGARYYIPWLGRWNKPDPAGTVDGLNLYAFVKGNPITYNDHDGLRIRRPRNMTFKQKFFFGILIAFSVLVLALIMGGQMQSGEHTTGLVPYQPRHDSATNLSHTSPSNYDEPKSLSFAHTDKDSDHSLIKDYGTEKNTLPEYNDKNPPKKIDHLDIWGEGRIINGDQVSGFKNSYNLNKKDHKLVTGVNSGKSIPNQINVNSYEEGFGSNNIPENSVKLMTLMNAPIHESIARDMAKAINKDTGMIVLYDVDESNYSVLEKELKNINFSLVKDHPELTKTIKEIKNSEHQKIRVYKKTS